MLEVRISLSPDGGIRLHVPDSVRRTLDIPLSFAERIECPCCGERSTIPIVPQALRMLKRLLKDASEEVRDRPGYIGTFPTQAILDAWLAAGNKITNEASIKEAREAKKIAEAKAALAAKGIDVDKMEFKL